MHFTPQQIQGGAKYNHQTRMGNWQEDLALEDEKYSLPRLISRLSRMKDYLKKKDGEMLSISLTEQKLARSLAKAPLSCSPDGLLHFGQKIMLLNRRTNGFLVTDIGDRIPYPDEAYAVTTNNRGIGPITRSVFVVSRVDEDDGFTDSVVHYGQKIRVQSNRYIFPKTVSPDLLSILAVASELPSQSPGLRPLLPQPGGLHAHAPHIRHRLERGARRP